MNRRTAAVAAVAATLGGAVSSVWLTLGGQVVEAQAPPAQTRGTARFSGMQPPAAGDNTYGNFLWIVDSHTGQVAAYRIAGVKDEAGKHDAWITERLLTDDEYYSFKRQQKK